MPQRIYSVHIAQVYVSRDTDEPTKTLMSVSLGKEMGERTRD